MFYKDDNTLHIEISNAKQIFLKHQDIKGIAEIECHPQVRAWLMESMNSKIENEIKAYKKFFRNHLNNSNRVEILIARLEGQVVGFLGLWKLGRYMDHVASIGISVHPQYWGKGIATKLIKSAIILSKEKGFLRIEIESFADNIAIKHIAEKIGFKKEGIRNKRIFKDGKYHDEILYSLFL